VFSRLLLEWALPLIIAGIVRPLSMKCLKPINIHFGRLPLSKLGAVARLSWF
jgi:hypothetical protein